MGQNTVVKVIGTNLLVMVLYVACGYIGMIAAVPPSYATPIWISAGIALGAILVWGWRIIPGIFIGALITSLYIYTGSSVELPGSYSLGFSVWVAFGAILQVSISWLLINHYLGKHNQLLQAREILIFSLIAGPLCGVINASWSCIALYMSGHLDYQAFLISWGTWWAGDAVGTLLFAPLFLILFAKPREYWQARFLPIFLPLFLCFIGLVVLFVVVKKTEHDRVHDVFLEQVDKSVSMIQEQLLVAQTTTESLAAYLEVTPKISLRNFKAYTAPFIERSPFIQALEWIPKVRDRAAFIKQTKREGFKNFIIKQVKNGKLVPSDNHSVYYPVYFINPLATNESALGFDLGSSKNHLRALIKSTATDHALMTAPIQLVQTQLDDTGALLFSPVLRGGDLKGFALGVINLRKMIIQLLHDQNNYLDFTVNDVTAFAHVQSVYHYAVQKKQPAYAAEIKIDRKIQVAGRVWNIQAVATDKFYANEYSWGTWLVLAGSVLFCILINMILFIVYGQRFTIEALVKLRTDELHLEENKNLMLLQSAGEGIYGLDTEGCVTFINRAAQDMLGYTEDELLGQAIHAKIHHSYVNGVPYLQEDCPMYATCHEGKVHRKKGDVLWRKDGSSFWVDYTSAPIHQNGKLLGAVVVFNDVTSQREAHLELQKMAHFDALTGLPNRVSFMDSLSKAVARAKRNHALIAVCFIDLDNFKQVNDMLGHVYGDRLLSAVADRLVMVGRDSDYLARLGGDEFALILAALNTEDEIPGILQRYIDAMQRSIILDSHTLNSSMSVGVALYPDAGLTPEELLKNADMAMYRAKDLGRNTYAFFDDNISTRVKRRHSLDVKMHHAIENNEFTIHYQPQVLSSTKQIVGVEALVRWHNPVLGDVMPEEFISIAEDSGFIERLGEAVLMKACEEYQRLIPLLEVDHHMLAVNISVKQLENLDFVQYVSQLLQSYDDLAQHLVLEVTESALMRDPKKAIVIMQNLVQRGVTFALDDFGVGYSSMQYLKDLPIKHIKIDKSFVRNITRDKGDAAIVNAIINLVHTLGLHSVAEGVETIEQVEYLVNAGCESLQGYYYFKPMPMDELIKKLRCC